ncbi:MAG: extracellular solute-binding protein [Halobacteriota archaeon]
MRNPRPTITRRELLKATGVTATAGIAGCVGRTGVGGGGESRPSQSTTRASGHSSGQSATIAILAAGSLQHALENGLKPAVDVPVEIEAHGSATVARMIAEGQRDPDIVTVADTALFERPLSPSWYSVFTSNAVVLAYNPETEGGRRIQEAGREQWYEPLIDGDISLGRTDPDQDPLGYRALFVLELASRYYETASNLGEEILRQDQIYPETALISQFETGSIDAAIAYRNMAVERDYAFIDLPDQIDLSNPTYADDWYSTVSYTLPSGQQVRGGLISFGSTIRNMSDAALSVFDVHTTGDYLAESGFVLRDQLPMYEGDVPEQVREATSHSGTKQSIGRSSNQSLTGAVSDITLLV